MHYKGKDRRCLALLLMDDAVMDRRWVTDRAPDEQTQEMKDGEEECGRKTPSSLLNALMSPSQAMISRA